VRRRSPEVRPGALAGVEGDGSGKREAPNDCSRAAARVSVVVASLVPILPVTVVSNSLALSYVCVVLVADAFVS